MPWCDNCDKHVEEQLTVEAQNCPDCSGELDTSDLKNRPPVKAPWHFWVMVFAAGGYLLWRLVEMVLWLVEKWL